MVKSRPDIKKLSDVNLKQSLTGFIDTGPVIIILCRTRRCRMEKRKKPERRRNERRRLLSEAEFRKLIEAGKTASRDKRSWTERRKPKRRKRQVGV